MFNFWWLARLVDGLEPRLPPLSSQKNKMLVFGLYSTSDDRPSKNCQPKCKKKQKRPPKLSKIKCSFLDYVQLLMISWVIWAKNVDRNAKKLKRPPKTMENQIFTFGLCSTSDDRPSDWSKNVDWNAKKMKKAP